MAAATPKPPNRIRKSRAREDGLELAILARDGLEFAIPAREDGLGLVIPAHEDGLQLGHRLLRGGPGLGLADEKRCVLGARHMLQRNSTPTEAKR